MSTVPGAADFEQALTDLQAHLPIWWRSTDPTSQLYLLLYAIAQSADQLAVLFEQPYLDQVLDTASLYGLFHNFAFAWGLENEQLPTVVPQLADYIQARAADDGSIQAFINALTALIGVPVGGPVLTFPSGGGGLIFPSNGVGLTMYEFAAPDTPDPAVIFPADGSGLTFPASGTGIVLYDYNAGITPPRGLTFPADGSGLTFDPAGAGLTFGTFEYVQILPDFATYTLTVQVLNYLQFDRPAFARAVAEFQPADWLPSVIQEVTSFT